MTRIQFQTGRFSRLVYRDGVFIGAVSVRGDAHLALDKNGKRLGRFDTRREALSAVFRSKRRANG
jgi:hypothetical protein